MKKQFLPVLILLIGIIGCKKKDSTAPTISLIGNSTVDVDFKSLYTDAGATANDNDKDLSSIIVVSNPVATTLAKTYTVTYNVSDEAGNAATEVARTVNVVIKGSHMAGTYTVKNDMGGSITTYGDAITVSVSDPNQINTSKFASYTNGIVHFIISGTNGTIVTIPNQSVSCGNPSATREFSGSGTISKDGKIITLNYSEITNGITTTGIETYTLQ